MASEDIALMAHLMRRAGFGAVVRYDGEPVAVMGAPCAGAVAEVGEAGLLIGEQCLVAVGQRG